MKKVTKWYARGGGMSRMGPFRTQEDACEALRYSDAMREETGMLFPENAFVWPESVEVEES